MLIILPWFDIMHHSTLLIYYFPTLFKIPFFYNSKFFSNLLFLQIIKLTGQKVCRIFELTKDQVVMVLVSQLY